MAARPMKNYVQVSRSHTQFLAGLGRALAPAVTKNKCPSLIRRQQLQLGRERRCELRAAGAVGRIGRLARLGAIHVARFVVVSIFKHEPAVKMKANLIHHLVMQDSVQPCLDPSRIVEVRPALQRDEQRFGHRILRPLNVAQSGASATKQASAACHDSLKKGVARLGGRLSRPLTDPDPLPWLYAQPTS